jgi:hypothetical protein
MLTVKAVLENRKDKGQCPELRSTVRIHPRTTLFD